MESHQAKKISISRRVINAILKLQENNGVSLVNLKKYLRHEKNLDVEKYSEEIKLTLKRGLDRDVLTRENGMYKVKEAKRGRVKGASTMREGNKSRQVSSKQESSTRKRSPLHLIRKKRAVKK